MGQKIHPVGFRLGKNRTWSSIWYAGDRKTYVSNLHIDIKARDFIVKKLSQAGVAEVNIKRSFNNIAVEIFVARPGMVIGKGGQGLEDLKKQLLKIFNAPDVRLEVKEIKSPALESRVVAQNIVDGIRKRISPKFLMSKELDRIKDAGALGGRIWVSGLIGGSAIHRTEKKAFGTIPLQTLRADISYAGLDALTYNSGVMGVKVWIYRGEKKDYEV
jgi:small subunit ribosomal protein S3